LLGRGDPGFALASCGLAQGQREEEGDGEARKTERHESDAPTELVVEPATGDHADQHAEMATHRVDRNRRGAPSGREEIRDERVAGRARRSLADPDTDPGCGEEGDGLSHALKRGEHGPDRESGGDEHLARTAVGQTRERDTGDRVGDGEGQSREKAHRRIRGLKLRLDIDEEDREDVAIDQAEGQDEEEPKEHIIGVGIHRAPGVRARPAHGGSGGGR